MVLVEKIGNIEAYAEKNAERDYTITLINGTDIIAQEILQKAKKEILLEHVGTRSRIHAGCADPCAQSRKGQKTYCNFMKYPSRRAGWIFYFLASVFTKKYIVK